MCKCICHTHEHAHIHVHTQPPDSIITIFDNTYGWVPSHMCDMSHLRLSRYTYSHGHSHWHCNTLQHTATHCNTLQHTATYCCTLQHTAAHCSPLQQPAAHCSILQHTLSFHTCSQAHICVHTEPPSLIVSIFNNMHETIDKDINLIAIINAARHTYICVNTEPPDSIITISDNTSAWVMSHIWMWHVHAHISISKRESRAARFNHNDSTTHLHESRRTYECDMFTHTLIYMHTFKYTQSRQIRS